MFWIDVALMSSLFAIGSILFGHFEEGTPRWRRLLKFFLMVGLMALASSKGYRAVAWSIVGLMLLGAILIHGWWLPKNGVNGWTGEPREKYYRLRGWKVPND